MKKLLLGSALAASVLIAGSSFAETKVTGILETTINSENSKTSARSDGSSGATIGHETEIQFRTSKELDNGLGLSAGFDVTDGTQGDQYLKLSMGSTTFAIGNDVSGVIDNVSQEDFAPFVANPFHGEGTDGAMDDPLTVHGNNGLYLIHKTDMFTVEGVYSPNTNAGATTGPSTNDIGESGSGYDLAIHGNFGIEGLKIGYGVSENSQTGAVNNRESEAFGVQYSMNGITIGGGINENTSGTTISNNYAYGISYAVNDALSLGYYEGEHDSGVSSNAQNEEYQSIQVGYDFGGLGVTAALYNLDNDGGVVGTDQEMFEVRTVTKF
jgi:hypothetical protein